MSKKAIIVGSLLLLVGLTIGSILPSLFSSESLSGSNNSGEREIAYWVAPMDPNFRRDAPGKSPMGMDLVPVYADEAGGQAAYDGVEIDPRIVANIGVETASVIRDTKAPTIRTVAHVAYNEKATAHVHVRANGWIEKLHVRAVGESVKAGDPLFDVYSPELNTAQAEFLQAVSSGRGGLVRSAEERLIGLGLSRDDIAKIRSSKATQSTMTVRAPIKGVITALNVSDQARVMLDRPTLTLVDLDTVWLLADAFEVDVPHIREGAAVRVFDVNTEERVASSNVDYIYPDLNMQTRTNPVRVLLDNKNNRFKPGQFFKVDIERKRIENALFVPSTAVIRLGDGNRVILAEGGGRFRPAEVMIGETVDEYTQIVAGLNEGETVVIGSQFLIDSESSFTGARTRLTTEEPVLETEVFGRGNILSLDKASRTVTINHQAIDDYDWPAGEREFRLSSNVVAEAIPDKASIHFGMASKPDGSVIVTVIHVMGENQ
ncbi:efflux RND transporter periplasmic adaptor subunit [Kordiimonas sp. SCSIO 12610]|uniref:efflux RND transporter periplasmic adaptor subunit n=1 Tax=Kordiimonas sp. SCSIO 12610 TaxID=2829597 RepID=UPI00210D7B50|nr:efflux RND transporter periplasmic adaptor subunit [Kordiimonas sp. SCSIO 12610]UTW54658.1 efflux RND transporter periplasmic adaptor subunit [Kordiimonas sp. SCSIO 12610]